METKQCIQCNEIKPITAFEIAFQGQNAKVGYIQNESRKSRCKACYSLRERLQKKSKFISMYGGKCVCCTEDDIRFLTLDHISNDGANHRKTLRDNQILADAVANYQPEKYQIMCYNCNCGRSSNGGICPHKSLSKTEYLLSVQNILAPVRVLQDEEDRRIRLTPEQEIKRIIESGEIPIEQLLKLLVKKES